MFSTCTVSIPGYLQIAPYPSSILFKGPFKPATCQSDVNVFWHQQDTENDVTSLGFSNYTACCKELNHPWMSFCSWWLGGCSLLGPWHLTMLNYECATNHCLPWSWEGWITETFFGIRFKSGPCNFFKQSLFRKPQLSQDQSDNNRK